MKAIILAAGIGSRIQPLTDNCPKSLLKIYDKTILEMMISHIQDCHINDIVFVTGYLEEQIKEYVNINFPDLKAYFVTNEKYAETNTGFSLLLAKDFVENSDFIKFPGFSRFCLLRGGGGGQLPRIPTFPLCETPEFRAL